MKYCRWYNDERVLKTIQFVFVFCELQNQSTERLLPHFIGLWWLWTAVSVMRPSAG